MADLWGTILASRHKKASYLLNDNVHEMPVEFGKMISGKEEVFQNLVTSIAIQYSDRVKGDYDCFLQMLNENKEKTD